jgi:hypothetical protein
MVARYAAPMSYNFLNLIKLDVSDGTTFENVSNPLASGLQVHYRMYSNCLSSVLLAGLVNRSRVVCFPKFWVVFSLMSDDVVGKNFWVVI